MKYNLLLFISLICIPVVYAESPQTYSNQEEIEPINYLDSQDFQPPYGFVVCRSESAAVTGCTYTYSGNKGFFIIVVPQFATNLEEEIGVNDSLEGFNRVMFVANDALILWVFRPVMRIYSFIIPKDGRKSIDRAAKNIEFPIRFFSCLLQARFKDSGTVFSRFLINTTLGVAGFFDVAEDWFDLHEQDEDFGQAFASWGIGPGCYLLLPILGPTTLRDGVGNIFDFAADPKTWAPVPGIQTFCTFNRMSLSLDDYIRLTEGNIDPYITLRDFWYFMRQVKIKQ